MAESSNPPKSSNGSSRNAALTVCAIAIATQIPATLSQITDPMLRGLSQLGAVIIVFVLGYFTTREPRKR